MGFFSTEHSTLVWCFYNQVFQQHQIQWYSFWKITWLMHILNCVWYVSEFQKKNAKWAMWALLFIHKLDIIMPIGITIRACFLLFYVYRRINPNQQTCRVNGCRGMIMLRKPEKKNIWKRLLWEYNKKNYQSPIYVLYLCFYFMMWAIITQWKSNQILKSEMLQNQVSFNKFELCPFNLKI